LLLRHRVLVPVRLQVPDLLVELEVVGLKRLDLAPQLRDRVELATQFLRGGGEAVSLYRLEALRKNTLTNLFQLRVALSESISLGRDDGQDRGLGRALERLRLHRRGFGRLWDVMKLTSQSLGNMA
jgi:hypothetical protein